jgi:hypothetical protein
VLAGARGRLPQDVRPRDLGMHRLRDLTEPVHVYQLLHTAHAVLPDPLLLVDPRLPDLDAGEALIASLAVIAPDVRVILMGWSDPMERPSLMGRAIAFLPKGSTPEEFVSATLAACGS